MSSSKIYQARNRKLRPSQLMFTRAKNKADAAKTFGVSLNNVVIMGEDAFENYSGEFASSVPFGGVLYEKEVKLDKESFRERDLEYIGALAHLTSAQHSLERSCILDAELNQRVRDAMAEIRDLRGLLTEKLMGRYSNYKKGS